MPASTSSAGRSNSTSRRRRSSTKSSCDEPSTSTVDQNLINMEEEVSTEHHELRANLIGRLFASMRVQRDETEAVIVPTEKITEPIEKEEQRSRLEPLNNHIYNLERRSCGMTLEEMLKDPRYASYSQMVPSEIEPKDSEKAMKTLDPIEVKIEEPDFSTAATSASHSVLPSTGHETNVERAAKREAHVLARIAELRKSGLWSNSRLPKCVEPDRNKTHWDFLLEEVKWMATDFRNETKLKKNLARSLATSVAKCHRDKEIEIEKAAERALKEKKKLCSSVAKMVRDFWQGVDKIVDIRSKEIIESRVRKARNKHLMFVIGQVNEMSSIVKEGLGSSKSPSICSKEDDDDFNEESESDDESTIANAEKSLKNEEVKSEIEALNTEANAEMSDLLATLPPEYLAAYGLTQEDLVQMRNNAEQESAMEVTSCVNNEENQSNEGNGNGRGVLDNVDYVKLNSENSDERQKELANIAEEALKFQPKGYTLETTQVKTPVPFLIRGKLREYQMVGLDWMVTLYEKNLNGILADEMGLGKTIQTISLLAHLACNEQIWGPHLIVVPTSVILNWEMEFKKWCPAFKILTYFGTAKDRAEKRKGWKKANAFHVCITSYKSVTQDIRSFKQRAWQYLILDEAHNIKNWKSQRWQALLNVRAHRRLLLTGTPLQNSLMELWSLMHFLMPTVFSSHDDFKDWFSNPMTGMMEGNVEFNAPLVQRLHKVLRPFILRRLKSEVEKQLPEKTEHVIKCSLSTRQRYLYEDFMSRRSTRENLKSGNMMSVLNIVMQLRKCCNHPNLFEPRPVVSPFVIHKKQIDIPAHLFNVFEEKEIPDIFKISERIGAYQSGVTSRKPLIEEIEMDGEFGDETKLRPPVVKGFRFNRTVFNTVPSSELTSFPAPHSFSNGSEEEVRINGHHSDIYGNKTTACIRSKTILNTAPLTISTDRSGFNYTMANSGLRSILDPKASFSPPLKKPKLTGTALDFSDYIPDHVVKKMDAARKCQLEIVRRRFGKIQPPILSNELMRLLKREFGKIFADRDENVTENLDGYIDLLSNRFGIYVEPVLTDSWQCRPSSSGLPSYIRNNIMETEEISRKLLLKSTSMIDGKMSLSRMLQFPELRLIEYDCGKLQTLAILLRQLYVHKHRCLIFTQMSKMLDILQTFLSHYGYQYFRLDGATGIEQRQAMMERFNADPKIFCFILSTRSGGVGVNLTGADTVIFYDSDWNPTMDAQAQDRCHRIGQTRNVSIYRLISERTIEENILKKAMQKRRLGELAIDEAGFTPNFFKQSDSIRDLFDGENIDITAPIDVPEDEKDLESAMAKCEDEADVSAARIAKAEAKVDATEFDETTKTQGQNLTGDDEADEKYMELIGQLRPIERYAISFLEEEYKPEFEEEVKEAEAMIDLKREEWDQKMNEKSQEEEQKPIGEEDLLNNDIYLGGALLDEILAEGFDDVLMPSWFPPSPPLSDVDFERKMEDDAFDLLYEIDPMNEARLPQQVYELRRPLVEKKKQAIDNGILTAKEQESVYEAVSKCLQMPNQQIIAEAGASPAYTENSYSMDDSSQDSKSGFGENLDHKISSQKSGVKRKRDQQKPRNVETSVKRSFTPPPPIREEADYDGAEWCIIEDHALLQAVQLEFANQHEIEKNRKNEGMIFNWEFVAMSVNKVTRFYRSARQCSIRYQMFVRPKDLGVLVACDPITKKTVKVELTSTELTHLRKGRHTTESQYLYDCSSVLNRKNFNRFKAVKNLVCRKNNTFWRGPKDTRSLESSCGKIPSRHEMKLAEFDVKCGTVCDAELVSYVTEDKIVSNEPKKKVSDKVNARSLSPTPRSNTLIVRPRAVCAKNAELLPPRPKMSITVPPLHVAQPAPRIAHSSSASTINSLDHHNGGHGMQHPGNQQLISGGQQHVIQTQLQPTTMQRRATSMANVQAHYIQQGGMMNQGSQGQSFMVVNQQPATVQEIATGPQRVTQYVPQQIQQQPVRGGPMYTSSPQLVVQGGGRGGHQRVVRGGMPGRMFVQPSNDRQTYVMQSSQQVRVMPTSQRVVQGNTIGQRRTGPSQTGTVAAMVVPTRGAGGVSQLRTIPRTYQGQHSRINVMVTSQNQLRHATPASNSANGTAVSSHVVGGTTVRRQLQGPGRPLPPIGARGDSPQTVAQVVLAPPSSTGSTTLTSQAAPILHVQRQPQQHQTTTTMAQGPVPLSSTSSAASVTPSGTTNTFQTPIEPPTTSSQ